MCVYARAATRIVAAAVCAGVGTRARVALSALLLRGEVARLASAGLRLRRLHAEVVVIRRACRL